jgi:predicted nucleic acid-binding protein
MRVLIDTNILLRSSQPNHPVSSLSVQAVSKLLRENGAVFFCPQNIAEFWNVATRPIEMNGLGLSPREAILEIEGVESAMSLLPDVPAIYPAWKHIIRDYNVQGTRLVATMAVYAVESILTFNVADFKRYGMVNHPAGSGPRFVADAITLCEMLGVGRRDWCRGCRRPETG